MCLVIVCVQRAGKIWAIVVRETAWSQFRVGLPSDWTCAIFYYVNRNDIYIYICIINGLGSAQYKVNYWTLLCVNHPSHHTCMHMLWFVNCHYLIMLKIQSDGWIYGVMGEIQTDKPTYVHHCGSLVNLSAGPSGLWYRYFMCDGRPARLE